jgi:NAD(P)H-dependent FMN reductase
MDEKLKLLIIHGTNRSGNKSIKAARFVEKIARAYPDFEVRFVSPLDFNMPLDGDNNEQRDPKYTEVVTWADCFVIVTPEYNHGIPGSLKRMLDSEYDAYKRKPVGLMGVSNGDWGGVRAIEHLLHTVKAIGLIPTHKDVQFPLINEIADDNEIKPEFVEKYKKRVDGVLGDLIWLAKTLKWGRENIH